MQQHRQEQEVLIKKMKNVGIQINGNYDLNIQVRFDTSGKIISGLVVGDVLYQNQAMLLIAHKGDYKENPLVGVGLPDIVNDSDFAYWRREITQQFETDGQRISRLQLDERGLILEAKYT